MANVIVRYDFDIIFFPAVYVGGKICCAEQKKNIIQKQNTQKKEYPAFLFFFPSIFLRIILRIYFYYIRHIKYDIIVS